MLLDDLASYLQAESCGSVGTDLFIGRLPIDTSLTTPTLALRHGGGAPPHEAFNQVLIERPIVQLLARGPSYRATRRLIERCYQAFLGLGNTLINDTWYLSADAAAPPAWLEHDEHHRHIFTCNIEVEREFKPFTGD